MRRPAAILGAAALLTLGACRPVTAIGDKIIGLTEPVLVGGVVLGTAPPADPRLRQALLDAGFAGFTESRLVVADALEFQDVEQAILTDPIVDVWTGPDADPRRFTVDADGWFAPPPGEAALPYSPGARWRIEVELADRIAPGVIEVTLPDRATVTVDPIHDAGEALTLDLGGQGFDRAFAAVYDLDGRQVWTNAPEQPDDVLGLVDPTTDPIEQVTIPGGSFLDDDLYIIGVAGLRRTPPESIDGLNEALTAVLAGRLDLFPLATGSPLVLNAVVLDVPPLPTEVLDWAPDALPAPGRAIELQLADLLLAGAPVDDASVGLDDVLVAPLGDGRYRAEGLPADDASPTLRANVPGVPRPARVDPIVPAAAPLTLPTPWVAGTPTIVDLGDGPWAAVFGVVIGPDGVTWSNIPDNPAAWAHVMRNDGAMHRLLIPPSATPTPGPYAVAIAALEAQPDALDDVNARFSNVLVGTLDVQLLQAL